MSGDRLRKAKNKRMMRLLPAAVVVASVAVWLIVPGKEEVKRYVPNVGNGYTTPTMATTHVSTLISDSGYTRYHMETPLWQMFEDADEPFWKFPEGIELEQYDLDMHPESTVVCDSAIYYSRKRIWQLDGNVVMVNTDADSFLTQQLFWDQNARKIYSDSFTYSAHRPRYRRLRFRERPEYEVLLREPPDSHSACRYASRRTQVHRQCERRHRLARSLSLGAPQAYSRPKTAKGSF